MFNENYAEQNIILNKLDMEYSLHNMSLLKRVIYTLCPIYSMHFNAALNYGMQTNFCVIFVRF